MGSSLSLTVKTENLDMLSKAIAGVNASVFFGHKSGPMADLAEKQYFGSDEAHSWIGSDDGEMHMVHSIQARPYLYDGIVYNLELFRSRAKLYFDSVALRKRESGTQILKDFGNELVLATREMVYEGQFYGMSAPNPAHVQKAKGFGKPPLVDSGNLMSDMTTIVKVEK